MDGENSGKPYFLMEDLGGKPTIFGNIRISSRSAPLSTGWGGDPVHRISTRQGVSCTHADGRGGKADSAVAQRVLPLMDGQNPAPPIMMIIPLFIGFLTIPGGAGFCPSTVW